MSPASSPAPLGACAEARIARRAGTVTQVSVGPRVAEPGARIDRLPGAPDLEVKLRARAPAAVAGGREHFPRGHGFAGGLAQLVVVAVETEVPLAVIDDGEQPQAREPVGVNHAARRDRAHRRALFGGEHHALPLHAAGPLLPAAREGLPGQRPLELAAQPAEIAGVVRSRPRARRPLQLAQQPLEAPLLAAQARQARRARARLGLQARERTLALRPAVLQARELALPGVAQLEQGRFLLAELGIQCIDALDLLRDRVDLRGACAPEVAVIGVEPGGGGRI